VRRKPELFGLGINNISIEAIARDADREARYAEEAGDKARAEKLRAQAAEIRKEKSSYRHTGTQKRFANGKIKSYKNLAIFNAECSKHGSSFASKAMICDLRTAKCLADGGGMATVDVRSYVGGKQRNGTWRLHFASCNVMKIHLRGRVDARNAKPNMDVLNGPRKRRK
jgi:hypothetical protein